MVSYSLQAIFTFCFGLLLANITIIFKLKIDDSSRNPARILEAASDVAYAVSTTDIFVSSSVAIASVVRNSQITPLAESNFVNSLGLYQILILIGTTVSYWSVRRPGKMLIGVFGFYNLVVTVLSLSNALGAKVSSSQGKLLKDLTTDCVTEQDYPSAITDSRDDAENRDFLQLMGFIMAMIFLVGILERILFNIYKEKILAFITNLHSARIRQPILCSFVLLVSLFWIVSVAIILQQLEQSRQQIRKASGSLYQDSQWGFGQVTAVLTWAPVLQEMIFQMLRTFSPPKWERFHLRNSRLAQIFA